MADTAGCFAAPLLARPDKLAFLLDRLCEHRPWFSDFHWPDPAVRRRAAILRLAEVQASGLVWEVYRGPSLVGVFMLDSIVEGTSAECHFVFFDSLLGDKFALCRDTMRWVFDSLSVNSLRVEIPTYTRPLLKFVRRLGFRYEAEARDLSAFRPADKRDFQPLTEAQAMLGSRKFAATLYEGIWHDSVLLSVTREEFSRAMQPQPPEASPGP